MKHWRIIIFVLIFSLFITSFFVFTGSMERERTENTNVIINLHNRATNWVGETNTSFTGGYGECAASDGKYIYILRQWKAGYSPSFNRYDPITDSWTDLSGNLPTVDFKNGVAITYDYAGNFYILTGSAYADGSDRVIFYKYNISSDTWIKLADTPHVQGAGDAIVYSSYDNMIYAFMGRAEYTGSYVPSEKSV